MSYLGVVTSTVRQLRSRQWLPATCKREDDVLILDWKQKQFLVQWSYALNETIGVPSSIG